MKAVRVMQPKELKVIDVEKPVIDKQNNVLVKMKAAGICGSDVGIYHEQMRQQHIRVLLGMKLSV